MMAQQPPNQQFDLVVLAEGRLQHLDPASRVEIIKLLKLLLNECVGFTAKSKEPDDE
jgi:hypothetical protein